MLGIFRSLFSMAIVHHNTTTLDDIAHHVVYVEARTDRGRKAADRFEQNNMYGLSIYVF
jgi:hypothetical protein